MDMNNAVGINSLRTLQHNLAAVGNDYLARSGQPGNFARATSGVFGRFFASHFLSEEKKAANREVVRSFLATVRATAGVSKTLADRVEGQFHHHLAAGKPLSGRRAALVLDEVIAGARNLVAAEIEARQRNIGINLDGIIATVTPESVATDLEAYCQPNGFDPSFLARNRELVAARFRENLAQFKETAQKTPGKADLSRLLVRSFQEAFLARQGEAIQARLLPLLPADWDEATRDATLATIRQEVESGCLKRLAFHSRTADATGSPVDQDQALAEAYAAAFARRYQAALEAKIDHLLQDADLLRDAAVAFWAAASLRAKKTVPVTALPQPVLLHTTRAVLHHFRERDAFPSDDSLRTALQDAAEQVVKTHQETARLPGHQAEGIRTALALAFPTTVDAGVNADVLHRRTALRPALQDLIAARSPEAIAHALDALAAVVRAAAENTAESSGAATETVTGLALDSLLLETEPSDLTPLVEPRSPFFGGVKVFLDAAAAAGDDGARTTVTRLLAGLAETIAVRDPAGGRAVRRRLEDPTAEALLPYAQSAVASRPDVATRVLANGDEAGIGDAVLSSLTEILAKGRATPSDDVPELGQTFVQDIRRGGVWVNGQYLVDPAAFSEAFPTRREATLLSAVVHQALGAVTFDVLKGDTLQEYGRILTTRIMNSGYAPPSTEYSITSLGDGHYRVAMDSTRTASGDIDRLDTGAPVALHHYLAFTLDTTSGEGAVSDPAIIVVYMEKNDPGQTTGRT
ncbi:MAG: hypothetical protein LIP77_11735 [Planctomycetes bacterium]|nr:hypothetical protein [Planctomycetota bacterium]